MGGPPERFHSIQLAVTEGRKADPSDVDRARSNAISAAASTGLPLPPGKDP